MRPVFLPRPRRLGALLVILALATTACVGGEDDQGDGAGDVADEVVLVLPEEPPTLEPCDANLTATGRVTRSNLTEALTERNPDTGEVVEALSTGWEQVDPATWRFELRDGVTFHDGTPFTSAAVVTSVERVMNEALDCNVRGYIFAGMTIEAAADGDAAVQVTTSVPDPILPLRMTFVEIVPETTSTTEKVREPVGTGPYQLASWEPGTRITLERYGDYWGEEPAFATAEYQWRAEGPVRAAMVQNGEADLAMALAPEDGAGDLAVDYLNNETTYLRIDATLPPLDDVRVRQAISYALDKEGLVQSVFAGLAEPAGQVVPDNVVGYNPDIQPWPYDPDQARALLAEAKADGVKVDTPITIVGRIGIYPKATEAVEAAQGMLQEVGLNIEIQMLEVNAWLEWLLRPFPSDRGPTLLQAQHGNQAGDAAFTMRQIYGSEGEQSSYGTPELDELITAAEAAEGEARQTAFAEALAYQNEEVVRDAVMAHMKGIIAISPDVAYTPNSATNDELRLAEVTPGGQ